MLPSLPPQAPPPPPLHNTNDLLTSLLLQLGASNFGNFDEEEEHDHHHHHHHHSPQENEVEVERADAASFDAQAYLAHASEYYAQPLLLTGQEPAVTQWPATLSDEALQDALLAPCKVSRIKVAASPPLLIEGVGEERPRLASLREEDIQVEGLDAEQGLADLLRHGQQPQQQQPPVSSSNTMTYAYGPLDVSPLLFQQDKSSPSSPSSSSSSSFWSAFPPPACLTTNGHIKIQAANIWLGQNLTSRIHVDGLDNLLCVSQGSKVVHLYSPWQLSDLDPYPPSERLPVESRWGSRLFHGTSSASSTSITAAVWPPRLHPQAIAHVKAGMCLFIPAGWYHEVFTFTDPFTVAISFWSKNLAVEAKIRLRPSLLHLWNGGQYAAFLEGQRGKEGLVDGNANKRARMEEEQQAKEEDEKMNVV